MISELILQILKLQSARDGTLNQKCVMSSVHEPSHLKAVTISKESSGTSSFHPEVDNIYELYPPTRLGTKTTRNCLRVTAVNAVHIYMSTTEFGAASQVLEHALY